MCVSTAASQFSGTILYHGQTRHPEHGRVHVLGYQNTAVNLASGPNAMLLHVPATGMTPANFVDTRQCPRVLRDMVDALAPPTRGWRPMPEDCVAVAGGPPPVQIFDHDIYTVVLATDPTLVPQALEHVPEHRRIRPNTPLFDFYAARYPGHAIIVCCFDNTEARSANPLLMWYRPHDLRHFVLPALDCHTGGVPDLTAHVPTDHWVILGRDNAPTSWGVPVTYTADDSRAGHGRHPDRHGPAAPYLPARVIGTRFTSSMPNGDFTIPFTDVMRGDLGALRRTTAAAA
jgi:hypothetical protein